MGEPEKKINKGSSLCPRGAVDQAGLGLGPDLVEIVQGNSRVHVVLPRHHHRLRHQCAAEGGRRGLERDRGVPRRPQRVHRTSRSTRTPRKDMDALQAKVSELASEAEAPVPADRCFPCYLYISCTFVSTKFK